MAFCLCDKISCSQKYLIKGMTCFCLWFQKARVHDSGGGLGSQSWGLRKHIFNHRQEAERVKWKPDGLWPLRALPSKGLSSVRLHLLKVPYCPQNSTPAGTRPSNTGAYGDFSHSNHHPQHEAKLGLIKKVRVATKVWVCISLEGVTLRWLDRSCTSDFEVTKMCQDKICNQVQSLKVK